MWDTGPANFYGVGNGPEDWAENVGSVRTAGFHPPAGQHGGNAQPGESTNVTVSFDKIPNYPRGIPVRAATVDYQSGALPPGLSVSRVTLPPEARQVAVRISAAKNTPPGEYSIFVCGLANPSTNDYILIAQLAPPLRVKVVKKMTTPP